MTTSQGRARLGAFLGHRAMSLTKDRTLALACLAACLLALGIAHGAESFLGLVPCAFCLIERKPYWAGIALSLAALALPRRAMRLALWGMLGVFLAALCLHIVHAGVEQHFWPDPIPECTVKNFAGMSMAERLAAMPLRPAKPCEDPDYLIPGLPVSMTQMAVLYALAISGGLAIFLVNSKSGRTP
jgi:disulfide bond formation protein DsbB